MPIAKRKWQWAICLAVCVCAAAGPATGAAEEPEPKSAWRTFWDDVWDDLAGTPDAHALSERRHFDQAGIAFDYPAVLHVEREAEGGLWRLRYGDFSLEVHESAHASVTAAALFDGLLMVFGARARSRAVGPEDSVVLCGEQTQPVRMQLTLLDEPHDMKGYDLPAPEGETRFLLFDDVLEDDKASPVAAATFAAVTATLRCSAARR